MNNINLPEHWKNVQLKEIASLRRENIQPEDDLCLNYVGLEHIDSGESQLKRYGSASEVKSTKSRFYSNDILYGKLRAYLDKVVIAEMEGICSTDILVVTANSKTIPRFLVYLLHTHSLIRHAVITSTGVNHPRTSWNSLGEFTFALPPLAEQRAIARVLQTIQEAKATRQREIALERERKATLMGFLFSHGTKGEPRKETEIGEIPESWEVVKLSKVADITYGVQAAVAHLLDESIGLPILTNINITLDGTFDLSTLRYYELPQNKRDKLILKKGDLLFNWRSGSQNHVGKTVLFDLDGEYTFSSFILRFRFAEKVKNAFTFHYFHYLRQKGFFALKRSQSSVNSVFNASRSAEIPVVLPTIEEQSKIGNALQVCDTKIAALEKEAQHLDELFRAMLDELMTGQRSAVPLIDAKSLNQPNA